MGFHRRIAAFEEDEIERNMPDRELLRKILPFILTYRKRLAITLVLVVFATATSLAMPYVLKISIDDYITPGWNGEITQSEALRGLYFVAILYLGLLLSSYVISVSRAYLLNWIGHSIMRDIRNRMFSHLQRMSKSFYDKSEVGILMSKVTSDIETLQEVLATGLVTVFSDALTLVAILVLMLLINAELTLYSLLTIPILLGVAFIFRAFARRAYRRTRKKIAGVMSNLQESISGIRVAQSFSRERKNAERFDQVNTENLQANVYAAQVFSLFFPTIEIIGAIGLAIVMYFGGRAVINDDITLGILILFQSYVVRFFHPIMNLTMFYNSVQSALAGAERIFGLLDTPPEVLEIEGAHDIGRVRGSVEFEKVVFSYVEGVKVLDEFDLNVAARERLAIVGPTGAGKSTIMNLLLRFYDVGEGKIKLDGRDIRDLTLSNLRGNMAIVLQDTYLFSGTITDNIRFGKPDVPDEEVKRVSKIVGADVFIRRLPAGYDTIVSERGSNLSVGQRQLISFARALLVDPPILLLDEATSSVDPYTELMIQDALEELLKNRTSIVIAHRLSTVRNSDRIIVLDHGKIVEQGGHEELIEKGGMYKNLCEMQMMAANS
jgi:ABC-type multidrug transport system fused ATPase/permease subunit